MQTIQIIYLALSLGGLLCAFLCGGWDERYGAAMLFLASLLSCPAVVLLGSNYGAAELALLAVDLGLLLALFPLALRSDRFWPLWVTGFHLVCVTTHAARLLEANIVPRAYAAGEQFWAYPMWMLIMIGSLRQRRIRIEAARAR